MPSPSRARRAGAGISERKPVRGARSASHVGHVGQSDVLRNLCPFGHVRMDVISIPSRAKRLVEAFETAYDHKLIEAMVQSTHRPLTRVLEPHEDEIPMTVAVMTGPARNERLRRLEHRHAVRSGNIEVDICERTRGSVGASGESTDYLKRYVVVVEEFDNPAEPLRC